MNFIFILFCDIVTNMVTDIVTIALLLALLRFYEKSQSLKRLTLSLTISLTLSFSTKKATESYCLYCLQEQQTLFGRSVLLLRTCRLVWYRKFQIIMK